MLFWLRDKVYGARHQAADSRIALVLIDEDTYATPPFSDYPKDLWTPQFGQVLASIDKAGAKVVGFDILLPTSPGRLLPGRDSDFLTALRGVAGDGRLVMAKFRAANAMQWPAAEQVMMVGKSNIRATNVNQDEDGVIRRMPLMLALLPPAQGKETTIAYEIARRAGAAPVEAGDLMVNFDGGYPYPIYSFADLFACNDPNFFKQHFADKVVLIGTSLDVEDRLITSRRFINPPEKLTGSRCGGDARTAASMPPRRVTLPGSLVLATAIDNLLRDEPLRPLPVPWQVAFVATAAAVATALALVAGLTWALTGLVAMLGVTTALATILFQHAVVVPQLQALSASVLGFVLAGGYRFFVADRDKRRIRQMFNLYLAPSVIDRMVAANRLPSLDGERRDVTFFFSDIASFTTLTELSDATILAPVLNAYFDGACDIIMAHGGLVIEFLGDGVQAMFGAPDLQPDHAARALAAAREVSAFSERYRSSGVAAEIGFGHTRIGVHSGSALVGNIGATRRLKYAALGDVVNTTSRLEGLNKYFSTRICISEETRSAAGDTDYRPLGDFLLKGKTKPMTVCELLPIGDGHSERVTAYRDAYRLLGTGDPSAAEAFARLQALWPGDACIAFHRKRIAAGEVTTMIVMEDK